MAGKGMLDEVFELSVERQTHSTLFMNAFVSRTLSYSRFTSQIVVFMRADVDQICNEWYSTAKSEKLPQSYNTCLCLLPLL